MRAGRFIRVFEDDVIHFSVGPVIGQGNRQMARAGGNHL